MRQVLLSMMMILLSGACTQAHRWTHPSWYMVYLVCSSGSQAVSCYDHFLCRGGKKVGIDNTKKEGENASHIFLNKC